MPPSCPAGRLCSLKITSVPAQHWSARGVLDRFKTLWCGYVVEAPSTHRKGEGEAAGGWEVEGRAAGKEQGEWRRRGGGRGWGAGLWCRRHAQPPPSCSLGLGWGGGRSSGWAMGTGEAKCIAAMPPTALPIHQSSQR